MLIQTVSHSAQADEPSSPPWSCATRESGWYSRSKLVADVVTASLLLCLLWPLIALLLALVKLTSRGPALYSQWRLGLGGTPYRIYKIRTMVHDCERETGPRWAAMNDPRVTPLGRFLRRSHLDELPQLWNVIRGEMSLVGPRPERPELVPQLERSIPTYCDRLKVRPGITGLAQVQWPADHNLLSVRRKLECDLSYIREMSLSLDFRILLATILKLSGLSCTRIRRSFGFANLPVRPTTDGQLGERSVSPQAV